LWRGSALKLSGAHSRRIDLDEAQAIADVVRSPLLAGASATKKIAAEAASSVSS
jgi:hypothetical protein